MFLTKECDYSLRIMRALKNEQQRTVSEICDEEHIPDKYAYKILKKLEKAGFIQIKRGTNGGYTLIRPLESFTIFDVVSAVDEKLFLFECLKDENLCPNNNNKTPCKVHNEFLRIQNVLVSEMKAKNMKECLK